jgi:hypothetical protein
MTEDPYTLENVPTVKAIGLALRSGYSSFPVLNRSKQLIGMISSNFLIVLLKHKAFYSMTVNGFQNVNKQMFDVAEEDLDFDESKSQDSRQSRVTNEAVTLSNAFKQSIDYYDIKQNTSVDPSKFVTSGIKDITTVKRGNSSHFGKGTLINDEMQVQEEIEELNRQKQKLRKT